VVLVSSFSGANQAPGRAGAKWFLFFGLTRATKRSTAEFRRSRIDGGDSFCNVAAALLISACLALVSCAGMAPAPSAPPPPPATPHDQVIRLAAEIRKAAYADDREQLKALVEQMSPFDEAESPLGSRAHYWRGFALWRTAWNAMNAAEGEAPDWSGIEENLRGAVDELQKSSDADPAFVEARIAQLACLESLAVTLPASERPKEYRRLWDLLAETQKQAPENPRLAWVFGTVKWDTPAKQGGGPDKAVQMFRDGLDWARKQTIADATDPAWGEAEILLGLTLARFRGKPQNLDAAGHYAAAVLNVEPNWRYVKDILIPQIQAAKEKANAAGSKPGAGSKPPGS
jgi:hypothetical protein